MCGIIGVVAPERVEISRERVERGLRALAHRGPDQYGIQESRGGGAVCVLAAARLRVIDLSTEADQPLANEAGTVWVAFNGELYNFAELRSELIRVGHRFRSSGDTEVLVHLYEECGGDVERMLDRLRGMFAFALFDLSRGRLVAARDRLGIKPLYYAPFEGGTLAVGSEARSLVATGLVAGEPDIASVAGFLAWGVVPGPRTIFESVRTLPPGHYLVWECGAWRMSRWWTPSVVSDPDLADEWDATRIVAAALEDAVCRHLVADRSVGVFLSGGIDSGAVATLAAQRSGRVRALTVTFPDSSADEGARANELATRIGAEHVNVPMRGSDLVGSLPDVLRAMDQPTWDAVNTWIVCRAARAAGMVVCLSGLGGDEVFGGYPSFRLVPRIAVFATAASLVPRGLRQLVVRAASRAAPGGRLARATAAGPGMGGAYAALRGLFAPAEIAAMMESDFVRGSEPTDGPEADHSDATSIERVGLLEMTRYLPDQLLRDTDSVSMSLSLEVRVPLLDDVVTRVALAVPPSVRFAPGKRLLAAAVAMAPGTAKRPFTLPFESWTRGPLYEPLREGILSDTLPFARVLRRAERVRLWSAFEARRAHWSRLWAVAMLRLWPVANGLAW